jgi:hypothetical protein
MGIEESVITETMQAVLNGGGSSFVHTDVNNATHRNILSEVQSYR